MDPKPPKVVKDVNHSFEEEEPEPEPNWDFVKHFDTFVTYSKAAGFVEDWIRTKKNNPTDFATDFPAVVNRGVLVRKILLHLRKDNEPRRDKQGYILDPEVKGVN